MLWIDQISINQSDNNEKADQIRLMTDIYQRAGRVIIYLGEPKQEMGGEYTSGAATGTEYHETFKEYECFSALSGCYSVFGSPEILGFFASRPWFERAWVVQEVDLAKSAAVVCGNKWLSWAWVRRWMETNTDGRNSNLDLISIYGPGSPRKATSLLHHLHRVRHKKATDPRDKVFSLMGILNPAERLAFADLVSYDHSTEEVYFQTAKRLIETSRSLEILNACGKPGATSRASWVPSWEPLRKSIQLDAIGVHPYMFDAGGIPAYTHFEERCMITRGIQVDIVQESVDFADEPEIGELSGRVERNCGMKSTCQIHGRLHEYACFWDSDGRWDLGGSWDSIEFLDDAVATIVHGSASNVVDAGDPKDPRYDERRSASLLGPIDSRNLMATTRGYIGLIPDDAQTGDVVCVLLGGPTPYVLRPVGDGDYILVGECYVYGLMNGQALVHLRQELDELGHVSEMHCHAPCTGSPLQTFRIV